MGLRANAPAHQQGNWADKSLQALVRAGRVLGASLDYHATLEALAALLVPDLADGCVVRLLDMAEGFAQVHVAHRDPATQALIRDYYAKFARSHSEQALTDRLAAGEPVVVPEFDAETLAGVTSPAWRELVEAMGLRSLLAVPMIAGGRAIGVLSLGTTVSGRCFSEADVPLVQELADRAATAVDHARLHHAEREARATAEIAAEELRRLHDYQHRLYSIIEGLDRQRTVADAARFISETAAGAIGAAGSWVGLVEPGGAGVAIASANGYPADMLETHQAFSLAIPSPAADAINSGAPVFLGDLAAIPLVVEGRSTGVMGYTFAETRQLLPVERDFLQAIARHAAIAFDRLALDSDLRAASERLELERTRLMAIVEQMPAGVVVTEATSGAVVLHNGRAAEILGRSLDGMAIDRFATLRGRRPDGSLLTVDEYPAARARRGETIEQERIIYERDDGSTIQLAVSSAPVRDASGEIVYGVSALQDISERARMEEELRLSRERLEQVLAAAKMGTWIWDLGTDAVTCDENLSALFMLPPGRAVVRSEDFFALVHPDDREFVQTIIQRAVAEGTPLDYEFRALCGDGVTRSIAAQGRVFTDELDRPSYLAGVSVDVTDRKLAEAQLREAQKMEAVGRLAGGMAHEINNMMSVVLGFTEFIVKDESLSRTVREDVGEIRKAAERAAGVTRQVLAFSRQQLMVTETLELNTVVTEAEQLLRRVLGSRIDVMVRLDAGAGHVRADPNHMNQVLVNLALNARDAMQGAGRLTIRTSARRLEERDLRSEVGIDIVPGDYVELVVADTGHGMDPATLARAFEPFFTTKAVGEGTGLGLSTVYGVVKQSHGYVWAETSPGHGAEFHLVFPRVTPEAMPASPAFGAPDETDRRPDARVLVVEDEVMVRSIARRSLEAAGYVVLEADDGVAALGVLASGEPVDLVVTDIIMPRMTGRELARQLRQRWPSVQLLYMSGHPSEEMLRRGLLLPGEHFVQKPFRPERLAEQVAAALGRVEG